MIRYITRFNQGSVRNEPAMMSMFYPSAHGEGCVRDRKPFEAVVEQIVAAVQSYVP